MRRLWVGMCLAALCGCATTFTGSATVPDGVAGCRKKCAGWGMELVGMVAVGDYSDGCICQLPAKPGVATLAPAVSVPAVVGAMEAQRLRQIEAQVQQSSWQHARSGR